MRKAFAVAAAAATILSLSACGATDTEPAAPASSTSPAAVSTPNLEALLIDVPDLPGEAFAGYTRNREAEVRWAADKTVNPPMCDAAGPRPKAQQYSASRAFEGTTYKPWVGIRINDYGTSDEASKALEWNRGQIIACPVYNGGTRSTVVPPSGHPDYSVAKAVLGDEDELDIVAQRGRFIIVAFNNRKGGANVSSEQLVKAVEIQSVKLGTSA